MVRVVAFRESRAFREVAERPTTLVRGLLTRIGMSNVLEIERRADGAIVERPRGDKRPRAVRVEFALRVKIFTPAMIEAKALNVSASGLLVRTDAKFTLGQEVELDFYLDLWHHSPRARVARIREDQVALEFINLDKDARFGIITYIATKRAQVEVARQREAAAARPATAAALDAATNPSATLVMPSTRVRVSVGGGEVAAIASGAAAVPDEAPRLASERTSAPETAEPQVEAQSGEAAPTPVMSTTDDVATSLLGEEPAATVPLRLEPEAMREDEVAAPVSDAGEEPAMAALDDAGAGTDVDGAELVVAPDMDMVDSAPAPETKCEEDFAEVFVDPDEGPQDRVGETPASRPSRGGFVVFALFVVAVGGGAVALGGLDYLPPAWGHSLRDAYAAVRQVIAPRAAPVEPLPAVASAAVAEPAVVPAVNQEITTSVPVAAAADTDGAEVDRLIGEGERFFAAGSWAQPEGACALDRYRAALKLDPESARAVAGMVLVVDGYTARAAEVGAKGDVKGARWRYERAISLLSELDARVPDAGRRESELRRSLAALPR